MIQEKHMRTQIIGWGRCRRGNFGDDSGSECSSAGRNHSGCFLRDDAQRQPLRTTLDHDGPTLRHLDSLAPRFR